MIGVSLSFWARLFFVPSRGGVHFERHISMQRHIKRRIPNVKRASTNNVTSPRVLWPRLFSPIFKQQRSKEAKKREREELKVSPKIEVDPFPFAIKIQQEKTTRTCSLQIYLTKKYLFVFLTPRLEEEVRDMLGDLNIFRLFMFPAHELYFNWLLLVMKREKEIKKKRKFPFFVVIHSPAGTKKSQKPSKFFPVGKNLLACLKSLAKNS